MTTPLPREISLITDFDGARDAAGPADRLAEVRRRATAFRQKMLARPDVLFYRSIDLITVPFPVKYGLRDAAISISPFLSSWRTSTRQSATAAFRSTVST